MCTGKKHNRLKIHSNRFPVNFSLPAHSAEKHLFTDEEATDRAFLEVKTTEKEPIGITARTVLSSPAKDTLATGYTGAARQTLAFT